MTNVLQNLRATEPKFDEWYRPFREEMEADPTLKRFCAMRTEILKEGVLQTSTFAAIERGPVDIRKYGPPPPYATSFFVGDETGGSGWLIEWPDGTTRKQYVQLAPEDALVRLLFEDRSDPSVTVLRDVVDEATRYIAYLRRLVDSAKVHFLEARVQE